MKKEKILKDIKELNEKRQLLEQEIVALKKLTPIYQNVYDIEIQKVDQKLFDEYMSHFDKVKVLKEQMSKAVESVCFCVFDFAGFKNYLQTKKQLIDEEQKISTFEKNFPTFLDLKFTKKDLEDNKYWIDKESKNLELIDNKLQSLQKKNTEKCL